jgi:hypothetical protein
VDGGATHDDDNEVALSVVAGSSCSSLSVAASSDDGDSVRFGGIGWLVAGNDSRSLAKEDSAIWATTPPGPLDQQDGARGARECAH